MIDYNLNTKTREEAKKIEWGVHSRWPRWAYSTRTTISEQKDGTFTVYVSRANNAD